MPARVLYLSYDGLMEPLGQSQIWQYLRELAKEHAVTLVTFEKKKDWADIARRDALRAEVRNAGVRWVPLRYHKRFKTLAAAYDLTVCLIMSFYLALRYRLGIVHVRHGPLTLVALILKNVLGMRFLFDMRGFWADERVDGGVWKKESWVYKFNKWLEKRYFLKADTVVTLTRAAVTEIKKFDYMRDHAVPFEVITTCANLDLFSSERYPVKKTGEPFTLGYIGNAGSWYLFDPALECFKFLKELRPDAKLLIINDGQHEFIRERLKALSVPEAAVELKSVPFEKTPEEICRMDAAVFFIKQAFSKKASAPTKLGELLGCGVPCLTGSGIGDVDEILEGEKAGIILRDFTQAAMTEGVNRLLELAADPDAKSRCVFAAQKYFSHRTAIDLYNKIYKTLTL